MSIIKAPHSPQIINYLKGRTQDNNKISQSLKVEKSRNSIIEDQDEQVTVIKQKIYQGDFSEFDNTLQQKVSPNETKILINNNDQSNSLQIRNHTEDAMISVSPKDCCFCGEAQNIFPICQCSQAHQKCANEFLQQGPYLEQIQCKNCNHYRHVNGVINFDFSQWKKNKSSLLLELLFLVIILAIFGALTYFSFFVVYDKIATDRILISCLVFSYTIWFILLICLVSRMLTHFKKVRLMIKRFDAKNVQYNQNYVNLMMRL
ncbi:unnamed protein product (macronuclear) [Paramecium tetraurelia]|uniref:RING-CH-type domain-containing protein n=1 Tax=Paramecium tetraurelia TaxID=5888 RepID=A0DGC3_PARTE|nr:uncharacterized protein GSPATT00002219001 [Paramecium tetraurelia]CAK82090.1 unnamed protein product [Paramecium tetraurelia]|eukprot:XP_001449487.1 hypothetical protein (macronuclear) [Paramecium tetraurelia strain d4-2]